MHSSLGWGKFWGGFLCLGFGASIWLFRLFLRPVHVFSFLFRAGRFGFVPFPLFSHFSHFFPLFFPFFSLFLTSSSGLVFYCSQAIFNIFSKGRRCRNPHVLKIFFAIAFGCFWSFACAQVKCSAKSEKILRVFFGVYALWRGCVILLITQRVLICIGVFCARSVLFNVVPLLSRMSKNIV